MSTKHVLQFVETETPIKDAVTKFGGQPVWISEPQWPLSRETGKPMQFICQVELKKFGFKSEPQMAYLFMTGDEEEFVDGTYEPDGGENALILQPGTPAVPTDNIGEGPTLYRMVKTAGMDRLQPESCEFQVEVDAQEDVEFLPETKMVGMSNEQIQAAKGVLEQNKIGGSPVFLQGDEFPFEEGWQLLLQLDSCSLPFYINFGDAGIGYAFLNQDGTEGKFLWQCG